MDPISHPSSTRRKKTTYMHQQTDPQGRGRKAAGDILLKGLDDPTDKTVLDVTLRCPLISTYKTADRCEGAAAAAGWGQKMGEYGSSWDITEADRRRLIMPMVFEVPSGRMHPQSLQWLTDLHRRAYTREVGRDKRVFDKKHYAMRVRETVDKLAVALQRFSADRIAVLRSSMGAGSAGTPAVPAA